MSGYTKYPPKGPSRRTVVVLIWLTLLLLAANVAHQAGVADTDRLEKRIHDLEEIVDQLAEGCLARAAGAPRGANPYHDGCANCREAWWLGWDECDSQLADAETT